MLRKRVAILIPLLAVIVMSVSMPAGAEETKSGFHVGIRTQIDKWTVSIKHYDHQRGGAYFDPDTVVKKESDAGFLIGPEMAFTHGPWFVRGFYLQGGSDLTDTLSASGRTEKGERKITGVDVGYGKWVGGFLGYRNIRTGFPDHLTPELTDQSVSDIVLGMFVGTRQEKPGFGVRFEMLMNTSAIFNSFDDDSIKESKFIGDAEFTVCYRFTRVPLTVSAGYGIWAFEIPVREFTPSSTLIFDKTLERQENWSHGGTVKVSYTF